MNIIQQKPQLITPSITPLMTAIAILSRQWLSPHMSHILTDSVITLIWR